MTVFSEKKRILFFVLVVYPISKQKKKRYFVDKLTFLKFQFLNKGNFGFKNFDF